MKIIAYIETDFPEKFGIPRQSGLAANLQGRIVFTPEYRSPDAVKGLEGFNYIWLLWQFEEVNRQNWSATVRPPRLGGNTRVGVFATRSPYRPNPIGLSSVRLEQIELTDRGPILHVTGADLRNHTPIYDIKPYLHYADCHTDATDGFASEGQNHLLDVNFPEHLLNQIPCEKRPALLEVLALDPRPSYHSDPNRIYGITFAGFNIKFKVSGRDLLVTEVSPS